MSLNSPGHVVSPFRRGPLRKHLTSGASFLSSIVGAKSVVLLCFSRAMLLDLQKLQNSLFFEVLDATFDTGDHAN